MTGKQLKSPPFMIRNNKGTPHWWSYCQCRDPFKFTNCKHYSILSSIQRSWNNLLLLSVILIVFYDFCLHWGKMCLRDCFALGLALIVSDYTPTSPPITFGLFNLIAVQSRSSKPAVWRHVGLFLLSPEQLAQVYIFYKHGRWAFGHHQLLLGGELRF